MNIAIEKKERSVQKLFEDGMQEVFVQPQIDLDEWLEESAREYQLDRNMAEDVQIGLLQSEVQRYHPDGLAWKKVQAIRDLIQVLQTTSECFTLRFAVKENIMDLVNEAVADASNEECKDKILSILEDGYSRAVSVCLGYAAWEYSLGRLDECKESMEEAYYWLSRSKECEDCGDISERVKGLECQLGREHEGFAEYLR